MSQIMPNSGFNSNPAGAQTMHDAWQQANQSAGLGSAWSEIYDCNTLNDHFSAQNSSVGNQPLAQNICFSSPYTDSFGLATVTVPRTTFSLEPQTLVARPVDVPALVQRAEQYLPSGSVSYQDNGSVRRYTSNTGVVVADYYALSGGVVLEAHAHQNPIEFTQQDAISAATAFLTQSTGVPSDAALTSIVPVYDSNEAALSRTLVGYQLTWTHDNANVIGGDAIHVDVDDVHTVTMRCLQYKTIITPYHPIVYCVSWQRTVTDAPGISYAYYLWREPAGRKPLSYAGRSTGSASIDAFTASLSLPNPNGVVSYKSGYWTAGLSSNDNVEHPAWLFTYRNGEVIAIDAFSGVLLGASD